MSTLSMLNLAGSKFGRINSIARAFEKKIICRKYTAFREPAASLQQLNMFPEYSSAIAFETSGNYGKAIPLYQRMHEVISSAMGAGSPLAMELVFNCALLQKASGNHDRAIQTITSNKDHAKTKVEKVRLHELLAASYLVKGDFHAAFEAATAAVDLCEAHEDHANNLDDTYELALFSPAYSILGVSSLFIGDLDNAETYLQLAARWAQPGHVQDQVAGLSNLGLFSIYKLGTEGYACTDQYAPLQLGIPALRRQTTTTAAGVNRKALLEHPLVREAVAYWQGALDVVNDANKANAVSQAAALCGVPSNAEPDMTGLGGKARMVSGNSASSSDTSSSNSSSTSSVADQKHAENLLLEPGCMSAYVTVLTNFAELYEVTGDLTHKEEYLSAALAVIKTYEAQLAALVSGGAATDTGADVDAAGSGGGSGGRTSASASVFPLSQVAHKPLLGRVLCLVAHRELSVGQAVVAEGLYRSALDSLSSPAGLHDPRYMHEKAIAQGGFGLQLTRWDKRAASGEELLRQSTDLLATVPAVTLASDSSADSSAGEVGAVVIPLTGMLQLPL